MANLDPADTVDTTGPPKPGSDRADRHPADVPVTWTPRPPTTAERQAAAHLAVTLRRARKRTLATADMRYRPAGCAPHADLPRP